MNFLYENKEFYIEINSSFMYDFNPYFEIVSNDGLKTKLHYSFKPIFPNFVYENYYLLDTEQQQVLISLLTMFLTFVLVKNSAINQISDKKYVQQEKRNLFNFKSKMGIINFCLEFLGCHPIFCSEFYDKYDNEDERFILKKNLSFNSKTSRIGTKRRSNFKLTMFYININKKNCDHFIRVIQTFCRHLLLLSTNKNILLGKRYYFIVSEDKIKTIFLKLD